MPAGIAGFFLADGDDSEENHPAACLSDERAVGPRLAPDDGRSLAGPDPRALNATWFEGQLQMIEVSPQCSRFEVVQPLRLRAGVDLLDGCDDLRLVQGRPHELASSTDAGSGSGDIGARPWGLRCDNRAGRAELADSTSMTARRTPSMQAAFLAWKFLAAGVLVAMLIVPGGCDRVHAGGSMNGESATLYHAASPNRDRPQPRPVEEPSSTALLQTPESFVSEPADDASLQTATSEPSAEAEALAAGVDPGALAVVSQIETALGDDAMRGGPVGIAVRTLRNQSRAAPDEVDLLKTRLFALLEPAGSVRQVRFVEAADDLTEYTLGGAVYLIERDGVEYWEIFFALRPSGANWRIWRNAEPVRLERDRRMAGDAIEFRGRSIP